MPDWKPVDFTFLYDGSFDGLLTIVFDCFCKKIIPNNVKSEETYQSSLLDKIVYTETDSEKASRIINGIYNSISYHAFYNSYMAYLSNSEVKEINILKFLYHGFLVGPKIDNMLTVDYVFKVNELKRIVGLEAHRLKGLVRFISVSDNSFYSCIHPDNNVVEEVGKHFVARLNGQNFIIVDKNRNIAFVYDTNEYHILDVTNLQIPEISEEEKLYQDLWKTFWKTIAIKERTNPRLQAAFMPRRYWKDLTEMN